MTRGSVGLAAVLVVLVGAFAVRASRRSLVVVSPPLPPPATAAGPVVPHLSASASAAPEPGYIGVIVAAKTVDLAPKGEGRVVRVLAHPGDHVAEGAPLAEIDTRALRTDLHLAEAHLADAEERLERRKGLAANVLSVEELANARALVVERRNRVELLRQQSNDARLPAPFDAMVAQQYADPGSIVGPGRPVVRLISADGVRVRFAVPEEPIGTLVIGAPIPLAVTGLERPLIGTVDSISPEVDAAARMILVVGKVDVPAEWRMRVASGMVTRVALLPRGANSAPIKP